MSAALLLAACGGGGVNSPSTSAPPSATPTPTPTPIPIGTAFAVEGARRLFGGVATLGLSSPLRVERARAAVLAPVSYDLVSGTLTTGVATFDLTPTAREKDVELGWSAAVSPASSLRLGVAHAFDAGHVAGATDTAAFLTFTAR